MASMQKLVTLMLLHNYVVTTAMVTRRPIIKRRKNNALNFSMMRSLPPHVIMYAFIMIKNLETQVSCIPARLEEMHACQQMARSLSLSLDLTGRAVENGPWIAGMSNDMDVMKSFRTIQLC